MPPCMGPVRWHQLTPGAGGSTAASTRDPWDIVEPDEMTRGDEGKDTMSLQVGDMERRKLAEQEVKDAALQLKTTVTDGKP